MSSSVASAAFQGLRLSFELDQCGTVENPGKAKSITSVMHGLEMAERIECGWPALTATSFPSDHMLRIELRLTDVIRGNTRSE